MERLTIKPMKPLLFDCGRWGLARAHGFVTALAEAHRWLSVCVECMDQCKACIFQDVTSSLKTDN